MKYHTWNNKKNELLKIERGISFNDVLYYIEHGYLLAMQENPNKSKYPNQRVYVVNINNYAYLVPYIETENHIFLKTIIPSRKATKKYLGENK
jgi:hypothetical protein